MPYVPGSYITYGRLNDLCAMARQAHSLEDLIDIEARAAIYTDAFTKDNGVLRKAIDERLAFMSGS